MAYVGDFAPWHVPGETKPYSIDFTAPLAPSDTIASVTADLAVAPVQPQGFTGTDPSPDTRLVGSPTFSGAVCTQLVGGAMPGGLQPGVVYRLSFTVVTTGGRTLVSYAHILCGALN